MLIAGLRGATAGRLLICYMLFRQVTAACGLPSVAGQAQTVRPLVAPMAEAAAQVQSGASERHSTACIEFRPGAGLWTVIGFAGEAARDHWQDAVKAAFRAED